jgi:DNA-binding NtrC family response regulator
MERKPVLLVVEEEDGVRHLLELALGRQGFHVLLASSGTQAVEVYRKFAGDVDLVLMDVRMHGMSGGDTLTGLKEVDPAVRCCFMTGDTGPEKADELLALGALHVFRKPFLSLNELAGKLRALLKP